MNKFDSHVLLARIQKTGRCFYDKMQQCMYLNNNGDCSSAMITFMNKQLNDYGFTQSVQKSDFAKTNFMVIEKQL